MRRHPAELLYFFLALLATGCVARSEHLRAQQEFENARNMIARQSAELDAVRRQQGLADERNDRRDEVGAVHAALTRLQQECASRQRLLEQDREGRRQAEQRLSQVRRELQHVEAAARQEAGLKTKQAANEAEVRRLTRTQQDLRAALQAEIAKGDVAVSQDQDRLAVQLVDRILFDSGQVDLSEEGIDILNRVSDVLKTVRDKQIRIEGHTDDLPIGPKLRERFPTNWELSTSRAITVVRYLIERGGVDPSFLSGAGYADTRPLESNDLKEGRTKNRRIEILLYPKDLLVLTYRPPHKPDERE